MSGYGDVKRSRIIGLLNWLARHKGVAVEAGGRHNHKVECIHNGNTYPIPSSHPVINKHVVKSFQEWLAANDVCAKEEFDEHL